jgi:hypothetical protein
LDGIGEPDAVHVVDISSLMKKKQEEGQMHLAFALKNVESEGYASLNERW